MKLWDLPFWDTPDWEAVKERMEGIEDHLLCPPKSMMFRALELCPFEKMKVVIVGQDPYQTGSYANGLAYSIHKSYTRFPPTLHNIFKEYCRDLDYPYPSSGDLTPWVKQGVLLWNTIPICRRNVSLAFSWPEWELLTRHVLEKASSTLCVIVLMGAKASKFREFIDESRAVVHQTSHPSPLGANKGMHPFLGSRIFTTVNASLVKNGLEPIQWKLD